MTLAVTSQPHAGVLDKPGDGNPPSEGFQISQRLQLQAQIEAYRLLCVSHTVLFNSPNQSNVHPLSLADLQYDLLPYVPNAPHQQLFMQCVPEETGQVYFSFPPLPTHHQGVFPQTFHQQQILSSPNQTHTAEGLDEGIRICSEDTKIDRPASFVASCSPSKVRSPLLEQIISDSSQEVQAPDFKIMKCPKLDLRGEVLEDNVQRGDFTVGEGNICVDEDGYVEKAELKDVENVSWSKQVEIVSDLNRFARQKPGGTFQPIFESTPHCILCSQGCTCLGASCLGPKPPNNSTRTITPTAPNLFCPGLIDGPKLSSLIELKFEDNSKKIQSCSVLPYGALFGWGRFQSSSSSLSSLKMKTATPHTDLSGSSEKNDTLKTKNSITRSTSNNCCPSSYDKKSLQSFLLNAGVKTKLRQNKSKLGAARANFTTSKASRTVTTSRNSFSRDLLPEPRKQDREGVSGARKKLFEDEHEDVKNVSESYMLRRNETCGHRIPPPQWLSMSSPSFSLSSSSSPEILRSSPSRHRKPPSPDTPVRAGSRGHTPRKDTPKKNKKLQCTNVGCRVWFTSERSRTRHESVYCSFSTDNNDNTTGEPGYMVPSHIDLQLSPLQCRFPGCSKKYNQEASRRRHEQTSHRMFDKRGRTISPNLIFHQPSPPTFTSRPQSCPPPQTQPEFLTPDRPTKRRRVTPVASVSSSLDSPVSPLQSPDLTLTPVSSVSSSSETGSESDSSYQSENCMKCHCCLIKFRQYDAFKRHRCKFRYDPLYCRANNITPTILRPPHNVQDTRDILSQLSQEDQFKLCTYFTRILPPQHLSSMLSSSTPLWLIWELNSPFFLYSI